MSALVEPASGEPVTGTAPLVAARAAIDTTTQSILKLAIGYRRTLKQDGSQNQVLLKKSAS